MKHTAVEWLDKQLLNQGRILPEHFEKAKQMEKEQIEDAFDSGRNNGTIENDMYDLSPDQYYKEKYGK